MSGTSIAIRIKGEGTPRHVSGMPLTSDDERWVQQLGDSEKSVRIRMPSDEDTEGHSQSTAVAVVVADDDDTEGHALNLHFPSVHEANDFRRQLIAAGLLTATIAASAGAGMAVGSLASSDVSTDATVVAGQASNLGQYDTANLGGTPLAPARSESVGQYNPANQGGTPLAPARSEGTGQYNPANQGGTPLAPAQGEGAGQTMPSGMGGMPEGADVE